MVILVECKGNKVTGLQYNMDEGPLSMTASGIKLGQKGTNCGGGHDYTIRRYADQVDEYSIWLEQQIKEENLEVMLELEKIFEMSQDVSGVVLITSCMPDPWITHAHACMRIIEGIANGDDR